MNEKKVLRMNFLDGVGKNFYLTVEDPKEGLEGPAVESAMTSILASNIFHSKGEELQKIKQAEIVTVTREALLAE